MASLFDGMKSVAKATKDEKRRDKEQKRNREREKALEEKNLENYRRNAAALEKKRKVEFAKKVKICLSKIMEVYPHMDGNYIRENDVEIIRDTEGNIMGIADGIAFVSNSNGNLIFSSKPREDSSYYYYAPMRDDNYQDWYDYEEATAKLGLFKTFSLKKEDVQIKRTYVCDHASYAPTKEHRESVYNQLKYGQVERALTMARTQNTKR